LPPELETICKSLEERAVIANVIKAAGTENPVCVFDAWWPSIRLSGGPELYTLENLASEYTEALEKRFDASFDMPNQDQAIAIADRILESWPRM
jgi:hypothetical protein